MHEAMVTNYQEWVRDGDTVYFLGDLTLRGPNQIEGIRKIVGMLPGQKHFILGNHDRLKVESYLKMGFISVHTHLDIQRGGVEYPLVHDPADALPGAKRLICGHVHEKWKTRTDPVPTVNIGVDQWGFCPVRFSDAASTLQRLGVGK